MEDFVCTSCWKNFSASEDSIAAEGGAVCPHCGNRMEVEAGPREELTPEPIPEDGPVPPKVVIPEEELKHPTPIETSLRALLDSMAQEEKAVNLSGRTEEMPSVHGQPADESTPADSDTDAGEDEFEVGFEDPSSHENTSPELSAPRTLLAEDLAEGLESPAEWCLRTSSGLTFRFTDPEALLGWKKKTSIYKDMMVSPDGKNWADYMDFVRQFEESRDPTRAFLSAFEATQPELGKNLPLVAKYSGQAEQPVVVEPLGTPKIPVEKKRSNASPEHFVFKTTSQEPQRSVLPLVLVIAALGAAGGVTWFVLHYVVKIF